MSNSDWRRKIGVHFTTPVAKALAHTPLTPNAITLIGFIFICGAAFLVAMQYFLWGGIGVLVASVMDSFDGALARHTGRVSRFGAVLDSTLDRFSEGVVLLSIMYVMAYNGLEWGVVLGGGTLLLSFSVSYVRARAEGMGVECSEGWFTRTERVIVIAVGLIIGHTVSIVIAMAIVAVFSLITVFQRLYVVWRKLQPAK
jgi:CDP-diacylglycerol--glycerol-3-phosphate 3-phosphatidyltransferase